MSTRGILGGFLDAVEARDLDAITRCFAQDAIYGNVPYEAARGRVQIRAMFAPIIERCERVRWDVRTECYDGDHGWLERTDRFWIQGREYFIECNGVYRCDLERQQIVEVRDYVDLGVWRARLGDVLESAPTGTAATARRWPGAP